MSLRALVTFASLLLVTSARAAGPSPAGELVGLLQELSEDYEEAAEGEADDAERVEQLYSDTLAAVKKLPDAEQYAPKVEELGKKIHAKAQPKLVNELSKKLIDSLVTNEKLPRAPAELPDLKKAASTFGTTCALCHGPDGSGKTPAAAALKPPPADLRSKEQMMPISPFRVFSAVTYGIPRTAMPAFQQFSDEDRWALAFYVFTLRQPECKGAAPKVSLEKLTASTDRQLTAEVGAQAMPCVRRLQFKAK